MPLTATLLLVLTRSQKEQRMRLEECHTHQAIALLPSMPLLDDYPSKACWLTVLRWPSFFTTVIATNASIAILQAMMATVGEPTVAAARGASAAKNAAAADSLMISHS